MECPVSKLVGLFGLVCLASCHPHTADSVYRNVESELYTREIHIGKREIHVRYLPPLYSILKRMDSPGNHELTKESILSLMKKDSLTGPQFVIEITLATEEVGIPSLAGFAREESLRKKIRIESGGKAYPAKRVVIEQNWGIGSTMNYIVQFPYKSNNEWRENGKANLILEEFVTENPRVMIGWKFPIESEYEPI
jgi:hypothetical protein